MKNNIIPIFVSCVFCFFTATQLYAQGNHELKIEIPPVFNQNYWLHYEYGSHQRWGFELFAGSLKAERSISTISTPMNPLGIKTEYDPGREYEIGFLIKHYFAPRSQRDGFFVAPFLSFNWESEYQEDYVEAYINRFNHSPPSVKFPQIIYAGIYTGYKVVLNDRWVIDPFLRLDYDFDLGYRAWFGLKTGYRLGGKKSENGQ